MQFSDKYSWKQLHYSGMKQLFKGCRNRLKVISVIIVASIIYIEWVSYHILPWTWPEISKLSSTETQVKILLVGDPQLLGNAFSFLSWWDSDRFIQKTYNLAAGYLQPDVIIFLADNFDDGVIATDDQFQHYIHRFMNVFSSVDFSKAIILPGDNDIGGEDGDPAPQTVQRFDYYFKNNTHFKIKFIELIKVDYLTQTQKYKFISRVVPTNIRTILSHVPLTVAPNSYVNNVLAHLQPHLIFSAHEHVSVHMTADRKTGIRMSITHNFNEEGTMEKINLSNLTTHEIIIPTCSYHMGVEETGYGAAVLYPNGTMYYTVLWLPLRLKHVYFYIGLAIFSLTFILLLPSWKSITQCSKLSEVKFILLNFSKSRKNDKNVF